jgi:hypothetical protein
VPGAEDFAGDRTLAVLQTVVNDFIDQYRSLSDDETLSDAKDAGPLPNAYSTSLHLCGLASAMDALDDKGYRLEEAVPFGNAAANKVSEWIDTGGGAIREPSRSSPVASSHAVDSGEAVVPVGGHPLQQRSESGEAGVNPYLTYWCVQSLMDWVSLVERKPALFGSADDESGVAKRLYESLHLALESAVNRLSVAISAYHAGVGSLFDAVDLICTLSIVAGLSRFLARRDQFSRAAVTHALDVVFEAYVHNDGSFAPKSAVMTTRTGFSLTVSTGELAAILMNGVTRDLRGRHILKLNRAFENVVSRRGGPRGWGIEAGDSSMRRSAFGAAGSLAFLRSYHAALDEQIAWQCAKELVVQPYAEDARLARIEMPGSVRGQIMDRVVKPIRDLDRRELAVMSFVLGGPPGTAKTTIAEKLAQELKWPILLLDQGSFLHKGASQVESEAERIFDLLLELKDTVVLLDEIEEMVEDRGTGEKSGRYLTTSMLPRIHHLRDLNRVVFMVATNYPDRIDRAARRPGRIDAIFKVEPPDEDERRSILESQLEAYGASQSLRELFDELRMEGRTEAFTFGYLRELVKACVSHELGRATINREAVSAELASMRNRVEAEGRERGTNK